MPLSIYDWLCHLVLRTELSLIVTRVSTHLSKCCTYIISRR
jgi:hypothetical protein